jgi:hypothetical protein
MNRRSALLLSMLLGGLAPRRLLAQSPAGKASTKARGRGVALSPSRRSRDEEIQDQDEPAPSGDEPPPPNLPNEPGQQWQRFDISRYTGLAHSQNNPQNAIIEWIFRRTGSAPWHGDKVAVLGASRTQLRAYHSPSLLKQVEEVVERFTNAQADLLSIRVRFVAAVDTRWRYTVYSHLAPVLSGPQGQQVWTMKAEDAALVLAQMQVYTGFRLLTDQKIEMVNGQTLTIKTSEVRGFTSGLQRESAVGMGLQPKADQLEEGVTLRMSPLLTFDGDALDAAVELTANTVKSFHRTRVIAPREVGPNEITIDVPEVTESRLNQTVKGWPLGQTLLISAGIQPGILQSKGGFLNLRIPGTVPSGTELLVFLDAEAREASRGRDRAERGG